MTAFGRTTRGRAFTLVEVLVAIGVVAVLAVGLAAIFRSVGQTVAAGQRVSLLNRYASQIEAVMREDFDRMTRDGFLVIRNELAVGGTPVLRNEDDASPRPRRVDELIFFARGEFVTARRPLSPDAIARSSSARIYYGHGQMAAMAASDLNVTNPVQAARDSAYYRPRLNWASGDWRTRLGVDPGPGIANPNRFAADWTLLRHVTLLQPPRGLNQQLPEEVFGYRRDDFPAGYQRLADNRRQVALQPAAGSVFRPLMHAGVVANAFDDGSGIGSLGIRRFSRPEATAWPTTSSGLVDIAVTDFAEIERVITYGRVDPAQIRHQLDFDNLGIDWQAGVANPKANRQQMQLWMLEAFPAPSTDLRQPNSMSRMRYEPVPPLVYFPEGATFAGSDRDRRLERAYREADQEMLSSAGFVPRCTEFIVEWSYGRTVQNQGSPQYKQLIWHGLPRDGAGLQQAEFYNRQPPYTTNDDPEPELIMPTGNRFRQGNWAATSLFGYVDPQGNDEWPWPRLIRVTMSFADPNNPEIEQTYQIVFEVPDDR